MSPVPMSRRLLLAVALGVVVVAFWQALLAGGSLVSADLVATAPPFDAYQSEGFTAENGPGDTINIHSYWGSLAADVRSGDVGWWDDDLAAGQPTFKGGLPVFNLAYLVVPAWFAPGLVAALRALTAILLTVGFLRTVGLTRIAALSGGIAFAFSGFLVGWMNWPHSSVAALAPGLLWALERLIRDPRPWRAVPVGVVTALMVWSNFPSVLIYVLLGVSVYTIVRVGYEMRAAPSPAGWLGPRLAIGAGAVAIGVLLAAPHLIGFAGYVDWADTSHRIGNPDDSAAGIGYLMTAVAPAVWGSDAVGAPWFGEGNWVEFNAHVGASVTILAAFGFVSALRSTDRRRRSVAFGLLLMLGLGVLIAYVGGPVGVGLGDLTGSQGGLMTRAKVLWCLGATFGAAFGVDRVVTAVDVSDEPALKREGLIAGAVLGLAVLVLVPSILDWLDAARGLGVLRQTIAVSSASILALVVTVAILVARAGGFVSGRVAAATLLVVIGVELLAFAMPVPTTVEPELRLEATPAHDEVVALLGPGERLAGEGRTFFPSTTELFGIAEARGQLLKSPGYQALLRQVDPQMLEPSGGGTPTYPNIAGGTDPSLPVWDALGVGVWAQFPDSVPPGSQIPPPPGDFNADPSVEPRAGSATVPEGGLRAVVIDVWPEAPGFLDVAVTTVDGVTRHRRWVDPLDDTSVAVAVLGEDLVAGSEVRVDVSAPEPTLQVALDEFGRIPVGTIAGDDEFELVRVGDVILLDRPGGPVHLTDATVVEPAAEAAAALVAGRTAPSPAVVDRDVGLPSEADPGAVLEVVEADFGRDRVTVHVETDRPALAVVSQAYYPGWSATVDGEPAELVVADAAFIGVPVEAGVHEIELRFRPDHLGVGAVMLLVGVVVVIVVLIDARRRGHLRWSRRVGG